MEKIVKLYVNENEVQGTSLSGILNNTRNWTLDAVVEAIESAFAGDELIIGTGNGEVYLIIENVEKMAHWSLNNGLREYDEAHTVSDETNPKYDIDYEGTKYKLVFLIDEIVEDFITDKVCEMKSIDDIPTGLSVYVDRDED